MSRCLQHILNNLFLVLIELYIPLVIQGLKESFFSLRESCFKGACLFNASKNEHIKLSKLLFSSFYNRLFSSVLNIV